MAAKTIRINNVDVTALFTPAGMAIEHNDIEGGNAGYMLDGSYTADVIATKRTITLACMPLKATQWQTIYNALRTTAPYVNLYYCDPVDGYITIQAIYKIKGGYYAGTAVGGEYYIGYEITFVER